MKLNLVGTKLIFEQYLSCLSKILTSDSIIKRNQKRDISVGE